MVAAATMGQVVADSTKAPAATARPQSKAGEGSTADKIPCYLSVWVSLDLSSPPLDHGPSTLATGQGLAREPLTSGALGVSWMLGEG